MSQALLARKVARLAAYKVQKRQAAHQGEMSAVPSLSALEADWRLWLRTLFPGYVTHPFAPHQEALWAWLWAMPTAAPPRPFIAIWPRGGTKSTTAELGTVGLGARGLRRYGLSVSGVQDKADDHVSTIGSLLEW